jgi:hypothetical protein
MEARVLHDSENMLHDSHIAASRQYTGFVTIANLPVWELESNDIYHGLDDICQE